MKTEMTSCERPCATMAGQPVDRVPVAPFVQEEYLAYHYPQKTSLDRVIDAVELANELDYLEKSTPRENVVAMIEAAKEAGRY